MEKQLHAIVHGYVQGVSFRYYTVKKARSLGLVGWVKNNPDFTVEVLAQGTALQLEQLLEFLHQGSPAARVQSVDVEWQSADNQLTEFTVRYG